MINSLERDLAAMMSASGFGADTPAVYNGDNTNTVAGIFDDEHVPVQNGEGVEVLVRRITFTCQSSKVPNLSDGKTLWISGVTYTIRAWEQDGAGMVILYLEEPE